MNFGFLATKLLANSWSTNSGYRQKINGFNRAHCWLRKAVAADFDTLIGIDILAISSVINPIATLARKVLKV